MKSFLVGLDDAGVSIWPQAKPNPTPKKVKVEVDYGEMAAPVVYRLDFDERNTAGAAKSSGLPNPCGSAMRSMIVARPSSSASRRLVKEVLIHLQM